MARKKPARPRDPDIHPVAKYFPLLEGSEFRDLCRSIKEHGLQQPIRLLDGAVIDGQNRLRACRKVGCRPVYKDITIEEMGCHDVQQAIPATIEWVWRQNAERRHLTAGQRAAIRLDMDNRIERYARAIELGAYASRKDAAARQVRDDQGRFRSGATLHPTGAVGSLTSGPKRTDTEVTAPAPAPKTKDVLARAAGVSPRTAAKALAVHNKAPELHRQVVAGVISLEKAYRAARDERSVERPEFRRTQYPTLAQLMLGLRELGEELPSGGAWVECCAGDGDLIRHVAQAGRELGTPVPRDWVAIELDESPALRALDAADLTMGGTGAVHVVDGQDFLLWEQRDSDVEVVLTNWPWPNIPPLVDHAFELYPAALVIGLCCNREPLDGGRGDWFRAHAPDFLQCDGRQSFDQATAGYQHPVSWMRWPPGAGRHRRESRWRLLPPLPEECLL